jgi:hypothetical protein
MVQKKKSLKSKNKMRPETLAFFRRMHHPEEKERNEREILQQSLAGPRRGGKPRDPEIQALMEREGISRQAAWYRLRRATGRPSGVHVVKRGKRKSKPKDKPDAPETAAAG